MIFCHTYISQVFFFPGRKWFLFCFCCFAAAAAAKSLQSCPTLCDPIDGSPPGSPIPGILQARTLEWVLLFLTQFYINNIYIVLNIKALNFRTRKTLRIQSVCFCR